ILKDAKYVGSYFTVRTVLPRKDDTDERPAIVTKVNNKLITVYSGKLSNCTSSAEDVKQIIESLS
ncbi:MAG: hypothetical protein KAR20_00410, partial [Candidatus Heimdallarchaeota archaeon]|nr:hypothetical protein [Candidatus Heimdallarchaeota archaeon]